MHGLRRLARCTPANTGARRSTIAFRRFAAHLNRMTTSTASPVPVARAALPRTVSRLDAVYNLQRTALFTAAIAQQRYDLLWDAMHDRIHQPYRESLVPGLAEALALPRLPGLLGIALSGAGPSILALIYDNAEEIGTKISNCFRARNIDSTVRTLEVDNEGIRF